MGELGGVTPVRAPTQSQVPCQSHIPQLHQSLQPPVLDSLAHQRTLVFH